MCLILFCLVCQRWQNSILDINKPERKPRKCFCVAVSCPCCGALEVSVRVNLCKVVILFHHPTRFSHCSSDGVAVVYLPVSQDLCVSCFFFFSVNMGRKKVSLWFNVWLLSYRGISALFGLESGSQGSWSQAINFIVETMIHLLCISSP